MANYNMIVDVVDRENRVVGTTVRRRVFEEKQNFRTVHILLKNIGGEILLQHLPEHHLRSPNLLGSSVAGYVMAGETYFEAARRKLHDELHVRARIRTIGQVEMFDEGCHKFVGVYLGTLRHRPQFDKEEISELVCMAEDELDIEIEADPERFTATFLQVYDHYRRWREEG